MCLALVLSAAADEHGDPESGRAQAFLDAVAAEAGIERTASGLLFQLRSEGSGASPGPGDRVRVHYEGRLRDGTLFDSSYARGAPAIFPLDDVVDCLREGLLLMRVGGRARIVCPAELGYAASPPPGVPANAPLSFEIELLGIER